MRLLAMPVRIIGTKRIEDWFSPHFFATNFWAMWRTTFAFQNWHSAIELKRYMLRFLQEFPRIHTLTGVRRSALNQYDSIVRPIEKWLTDQRVQFEYGTKVTDVDFVESDGHRIKAIHGTRHGKDVSYAVGLHDYAFITIGSMTADSRCGDDDHPPQLVRDKADGAWALWETMARKARPCRPLASLGRWLDAAALQYIGHSPTTNTVAQVAQRPLNPGVSPARIVLGNGHNQSGDLLHDPWPPRPAPVHEIPLLGNQPSMPAQQSIGRNERVQFEQGLTSHCLGFPREQRPVCIGEPDSPTAQPVFKQSVFGLEKLDDDQLVAMNPTSRDHQRNESSGGTEPMHQSTHASAELLDTTPLPGASANDAVVGHSAA